MYRLNFAFILCAVAIFNLTGCAYLNPGDRLAPEPKQSAIADPKEDTSFADFLGFLLFPIAQGASQR